MNELIYSTEPAEVETLLKIIHAGTTNPKQIYGEDGSMLQRQYYKSKKLGVKLGFVTETTRSIRLTERGHQVVTGSNRQQTEAYRNGIAEFPQYQIALTLIQRRNEYGETVSSRECGRLLLEIIDRSYSGRRPNRAATTLFRTVAQAGLGEIVSLDNKMNGLKLDHREVADFIEPFAEEAELAVTTDTNEGTIRVTEGSWQVSGDTLSIKIPLSNRSREDLVTLINTLENKEKHFELKISE